MHVELPNADVRREMMDKIGGQKDQPVKIKCVLGGAEVRIRKALTEDATKRNSALRRAADVIRADARCAHKTVKIQFTGERGVTVDLIYAFNQDKQELTGKFSGAFADLRLP